MGLDIRLQQRLDLSLKLAPQIIQSIELLQLPAMDLLEMIEQELDTNEFLEKVPAELAPEPAKEAKGEDGEITDDEVERYDQMDIWDDPSLRRPRSKDDDRMHAKMEAMQNTASEGPSLQSRLLEQYHLLEGAERDLPLAEQIIFNIDDRGYLTYTLSEILEPVIDQYSIQDAERVLYRIQSLEPRGVGARSTKECLLLQLRPADPHFDLKVQLVEHHLEDVEKNRLPKVARDLGLSMDELKELLQELSELTLRPGTGDRQDRNHYIMPDVIVEWNGNDYEIRLANEFVPELRLSSEYRLVLSDPTAGREYREYVKRKVDSARAFIMAVEKRQKTLLDVAKRIIHHQRDFLDFGPHYLRPLKMQEVADDLHVHVSTISRATSDKYMQTHRGIFSLKDFFTGGTRSTSGEMESRESIKQKIQEIVDREDKDSPLSDDDLVVKLQELHGVLVARRTVTKYRKALGLPSSRQRREYR
ncbi:MAG TPA: RNA polymerase factor sigma-54 [Planctomycetota bacterium]|jgi:RNA polymerase sigma-54 factor|nr:RNA polymerase factor sigma-54 [Planctomycetota bacterium]